MLEIATVASGFIIPKLIIGTFGSSINGLVASITQFMGYLTLLQSGIGGVVKASLYKPLANKEIETTSGIIKATEIFFRKIAYITVIYVIALTVIFPYIINNKFNVYYTGSMVLIIGIGSFVQYYFGITYQILLQADQKDYVNSIIQMCLVVINTLVIIVLVKINVGIHIVKLASILIFAIRPLLLNVYVKKKYKINNKCKPDMDSIEQRWDGFGHTVAYFIHKKTDVMLLTLFSSLVEVSVYSVYMLVTNGLNMLISIISSAVQAAFGNMIAREEYDVLDRNFKSYECFINMITVILFTSASILILPFIKLYTNNFVDNTNYIRPLFAYVILLAEGVYCIRQPYHSIVISSGHYKYTKKGAFIEAIVNLLVSLVLIKPLGIIGVAIGTLVAMIVRTIDYALYLRNNIIFLEIKAFVKRIVISIINVICILIIIKNTLLFKADTYLIWVIYGISTTLFSSAITIMLNLLFYKDEITAIHGMIKRLIIKK